jgi:DNA-binding transcriptional ArsR family regulator
MPPKESDRRLEIVQARALNHPLRLRILEMHKRERGRSMTVEALTTDLRRMPGYEHVKAAEVKYHCDRLRDADLLSASGDAG